MGSLGGMQILSNLRISGLSSVGGSLSPKSHWPLHFHLKKKKSYILLSIAVKIIFVNE